MSYSRKAVLRYGENPHQQAALYADAKAAGTDLVSAVQLHGKELSYNNFLDLDSALEIVRGFAEPAVSVIKHNNPCGAAVAETPGRGPAQGLAGDPVSAFGSVLGMNRVVDAATAEVLAEPGLFVEAIAAPDFSPEALEILTTKPKWKANVRLMKVGDPAGSRQPWAYRFIDGGVLVQEADMPARPGSRVEGRDRGQADRGPNGRSPVRLGDRAARQVQRHCVVQGPDALGRRGGPDEPGRFDGDRRQEGGRSGGRLRDGLRRLLSLPRLDRKGRGCRRHGRHSARRLGQGRRRGRRLQPLRPLDDLHRPAAF